MPASPRNPDDELPDLEQRYQRMKYLSDAPVLPLGDVAEFLDLPVSTLNQLRAQGQGPKAFKIGRRLYVMRTELLAWLKRLSVEAAA